MRRLLIAALVVPALLAPATAGARDKWNTKVLAPVPKPGFPAHPYVDPQGRIWEGTYVNSNGDVAAVEGLRVRLPTARCCATSRCPASSSTQSTASRSRRAMRRAAWCCSTARRRAR